MTSTARVIFAEDFCAEWRRRPGTIEICLWGTADLATEQAAVMAIDEARAAAELEKVREVRVDVCAIEFIASSCIKYFASWFVGMQDGGVPTYTVTLVWDPTNSWQTRFKDTLCSLAPAVLDAREGQGPNRTRPMPA
jgi:hypothetical protein